MQTAKETQERIERNHKRGAAARVDGRFEVGEHIELHGVRFRVAEKDGRRLVLEVPAPRIRAGPPNGYAV